MVALRRDARPAAHLPRPKMRSASPSAIAATPQAARPATIAPSRSLSLTRSSAKPFDHAFAVGEGAGDGERGNFVDHRRDLLGAHMAGLEAVE